MKPAESIYDELGFLVSQRDRARLQRASTPSWMRDLAAKLAAEVASLRKQLADGPADSDTVLYGHVMQPDKPLGKGPTIRFGGAENPYAYGIHVRWDAKEDILDVNGDGRLIIRPRAATAFTVQRES
jgi:hypothetical protein